MNIEMLSETNAVCETLKHQDSVLFHVCNNYGVMGSGIALEIKNRIPSAYENYLNDYHIMGTDSLGKISFSNEFNVCNLVSQDGYGSKQNSIRYIKYNMLIRCLQRAVNLIKLNAPERKTAIIPYLMGSDRAGGDWETVLEITIEILEQHFDTLLICSIDALKK